MGGFSAFIFTEQLVVVVVVVNKFDFLADLIHFHVLKICLDRI